MNEKGEVNDNEKYYFTESEANFEIFIERS